MSCGCENMSFYNSLSLSWLLLHTLHAPTLSGFNIYKPLCTFNSLDMYCMYTSLSIPSVQTCNVSLI